MDDLGARRVSAQVVVSLPRIDGPDWSLGKAAAAVGAGVFQNGLGARRAKSTFIGTDACLRGVCGQRFVAVFTGWSEFEHLLEGTSIHSRHKSSMPSFACSALLILPIGAAIACDQRLDHTNPAIQSLHLE